jgi:uncharacterized protein DUF3854
VNPHLALLLSAAMLGSLAPAHLEDLRKSGLSDETIRAQGLRSVPPSMIPRLLGFDRAAIRSAMLIPFPAPDGGWLDHIRMKVFPSLTTERGTVKYLQPQRSGVRIYFPLATMLEVLHGAAPLWICEGEKKSLALGQLGLPAIGLCGIEGWHLGGSRALHPDLDAVRLEGRVVKVVPDGDVHTNPAVERGAARLAEALERRGARADVVMLPIEEAA